MRAERYLYQQSRIVGLTCYSLINGRFKGDARAYKLWHLTYLTFLVLNTTSLYDILVLCNGM